MNFSKKISVKKKAGQYGFTLIEVLLSLTILAIILTSFMGFFTQSAMVTQKNSRKLGSMETAQLIIKMIDKSVTKETLKQSKILTSGTSGEVINTANSVYQLNGISDIQTKLGLTLDSSIVGDVKVIFTQYKFPAVISTDNTNKYPLIQAEVIVNQDSSGRRGDQSITYTYIRK